METVTEKLLSQLNAARGLKYPDIGYSYFADVTGDGRKHRSIYTIINAGGGVTYSDMNASNSRGRCDNVRAAITMLRDAKTGKE